MATKKVEKIEVGETKAKAVNADVSLKEQLDRLNAELSEIDFDENRDEYKKKADELGKVAKKYFSERVLLKIRKPYGEQDKHASIIWNGNKYSIEYGKEVMVPRAVAQIYLDAETQRDDSDAYIQELQEDYDSKKDRLAL